MATDVTSDARSVLAERVMPHPPEKVWRALKQGPLIQEWPMPNDFEPVVGHRFKFKSTPMPHWNGVVGCGVLVVEPNQRLSYCWNASGEEAATGIKTVVTWTPTTVDGGTHVRMEQSGFQAAGTGNFQGANFGWLKYFAGLERVAAGLS
jgi:uncharacterized protein YndB with AHSA1/START domain